MKLFQFESIAHVNTMIESLSCIDVFVCVQIAAQHTVWIFHMRKVFILGIISYGTGPYEIKVVQSIVVRKFLGNEKRLITLFRFFLAENASAKQSKSTLLP